MKLICRSSTDFSPGEKSFLVHYSSLTPPLPLPLSLRSLTNRTLPYFAFSRGEDPRASEKGLQDRSHMYLARAVVLNLRTGETSSSLPDQQHADRDALAIAVEFVGSRFVRNMVRVLVATALRECLQQQQREKEVDPQILVKYCQISDR